ncbi:MAG: bifunctional folylpolyglutamate synthase/dihydrofolate synthase [Muribaculaceae bacterium]|nr:bifunctional folylpolyglutamate synthase/dihydrofolate synthase [Muribaculaceae bacterium]
MNYSQTLEYLFGQLAMFSRTGAEAYKPGLGATFALSDAFGSPHKAFPAIHVGGTNGKGSVSHTLAAVLQSAGYKVGLYTSPHLVDFRERIRVNGRPISEEAVVDFVRRFREMPLSEKLTPSFFEFTTVMAFEHFAREKVDVAVVEVGLGGRLDSTNILADKLLTIVTNISLDHTVLLGNTEAEIAAEKAGIFAPGVPAVVGNPGTPEVHDVFVRKAEEADVAFLLFASEQRPYREAHRESDRIVYTGTPFGTLEGALTGDCQTENAATILASLTVLARSFPALDDAAVRQGFAQVCSLTGLMGRWMRLPAPEGIDLVCDTGHNIGGWRLLGPRLRDIAYTRPLTMVVGFVNDKDVTAIMGQMPRTNVRYIFVEPSIPRARSAESTAALALEAGLPEGIAVSGPGSVKEGCRIALEQAAPGSFVFVGGSTFVVADLLA